MSSIAAAPASGFAAAAFLRALPWTAVAEAVVLTGTYLPRPAR